MKTRLFLCLHRAGRPRVACAALLACAGTASADLVDIFAEHEFRFTTQMPFAMDEETDITSGLTNGVAVYDESYALNPGTDTSSAAQDITITANAITVDLEASTQAAGAIASANFEGTFTLDAATTLTVAGSSNGGFGSFTGGSSFTLIPDGEPFSNALVALTGLDGINYSTALPSPIALDAGRYDFKISTSLAGGAIGTRFHDLNLQFGAGSAPTGDFNGSGQVEQGDLDLVLQNWGVDTNVAGIPTGWTNTDDLNGQIEQTELDAILQNWGSTTVPDFSGSNVPEPATATAAFVCAGVLTFCRRPCRPFALRRAGSDVRRSSPQH